MSEQESRRSNIQIDRLHLRVRGLPAGEVRAAVQGLGEQVLRQLNVADGLQGTGNITIDKIELSQQHPIGVKPSQLRQRMASEIAQAVTSASKPENGKA